MSPRLALGAACLLLGVSEVVALTQSLQRYSQRWEGALHEARAAVARDRALLEEVARVQGPGRVAALAVSRGLGSEAEVFEAGGRRLAAVPRSPRVTHRLSAAQRARARALPLAIGPLAGPEPRILVYVGLGSEPQDLLLRLARPVSAEPSALPSAHRADLIAHAAVLGLTLAAGLLAFAPVPSEPGRGGALRAYEQALDRLRSQGEALSREHDEERQRMEGELKELEALARAGELTAGVVHEVRNGLGTVLGYARMLERDPGAAAEAGLRIREECEALEGVVRRFVDYVRQERLDVAPIAVAGLLARVAGREGRARDDVLAEVAVEPGLTLHGDESLLERALENVVRNAYQVSPPHAALRLEGRVAGAFAELVVEDSGPGLALSPSEALRPFRSARPGGLGLGLALAHKLVRLHGGSIRFEPVARGGLRVVLSLPLQGPAVENGNVGAEPGAGAPPDRARQGLSSE